MLGFMNWEEDNGFFMSPARLARQSFVIWTS